MNRVAGFRRFVLTNPPPAITLGANNESTRAMKAVIQRGNEYWTGDEWVDANTCGAMDSATFDTTEAAEAELSRHTDEDAFAGAEVVEA